MGCVTGGCNLRGARERDFIGRIKRERLAETAGEARPEDREARGGSRRREEMAGDRGRVNGRSVPACGREEKSTHKSQPDHVFPFEWDALKLPQNKKDCAELASVSKTSRRRRKV